MKEAAQIRVESHLPLDVRLERIEALLRELRDGLAPSIPKRIGQAAATACGAVLGATLLIIVLVTILQPLTKLQVVGDKVDRLINALERPKR